MSKIYTRTGDTGQTGLIGGKRVAKSQARIQAIGEVDELNSVLGLLLAAAPQIAPLAQPIQHQLFDLGAELAQPGTTRIKQDQIKTLEHQIDEISAQLPPLKEFILPGGCMAGATTHLARTVCRRAERSLVNLAQTEAVNPDSMGYLNRLSDLLFVLARQLNLAESAETPWQPA